MNDLNIAATEELAELGSKSRSQWDAFAGTFRVLGLAWNPGIYRQFHPDNVLRLPVPFAQRVTKSLLRLYDSFVEHNDRPIDVMFQNFFRDEIAEGVRERETAFDQGAVWRKAGGMKPHEKGGVRKSTPPYACFNIVIV